MLIINKIQSLQTEFRVSYIRNDSTSTEHCSDKMVRCLWKMNSVEVLDYQNSIMSNMRKCISDTNSHIFTLSLNDGWCTVVETVIAQPRTNLCLQSAPGLTSNNTRIIYEGSINFMLFIWKSKFVVTNSV